MNTIQWWSEMHQGMVDALGEMENLSYHHKGHQTTEWKLYNRMIGWLTELERRMIHYATTRKNVEVRRKALELAEAADAMVGHAHGNEHGRRLAADFESDGGPDALGSGRLDADPTADSFVDASDDAAGIPWSNGD